MTKTLKTGSGSTIQISREVARGGEGIVNEVVGQPNHVAKIYHQAITKDKAEKLQAMVALKNESLIKISAWPTEILVANDSKACGFIMPKLSGYRPIHELYSPKCRKDHFPKADWRFLIHTATNIARAFATVHENNCVIGDVNHGSVFASQNATVQLIDCDSFQISLQQRTYPCLVGVPDYQPPELQKKSFSGVIRTLNHDAFGLAVMIFKLLFMNRHPFSGKYTGMGDMPTEKAIHENRFAYGANHRSYHMEPPPNSLRLDAITPNIANLFERAFSPKSQNGGRPSAKEWIVALEEMSRNLKSCAANNAHYHYSGLPSCPWCRIEGATGATMFSIFATIGIQPSTLNIGDLWAKISSIHRPPPAGEKPTVITPMSVSPTPEAIDAGNKRGKIHAKNAAIILLSVVIAFASGGMAWWLFLVAIFATYVMSKRGPDVSIIASAYADAHSKYEKVLTRWKSETGTSRFDDKYNELVKIKSQLEQIPIQKTQRLKKLEAEREKDQREKYLDSFRLERAQIEGIGAGRKATLISYNIETALDVTDHSIRQIPGFGNKFTSRMMEWRRGIEQRFRFNPNQAIDPRDVMKIEQEFNLAKAKLEGQIMSGMQDLTNIRNHILTVRKSLEHEANLINTAMVQAEANKKAAKVF